MSKAARHVLPAPYSTTGYTGDTSTCGTPKKHRSDLAVHCQTRLRRWPLRPALVGSMLCMIFKRLSTSKRTHNMCKQARESRDPRRRPPEEPCQA